MEQAQREGGPPMPLTIVFVERKSRCNDVAEVLQGEGVPAVPLHGGLTQVRVTQRQRPGSRGVLLRGCAGVRDAWMQCRPAAAAAACRNALLPPTSRPAAAAAACCRPPPPPCANRVPPPAHALQYEREQSLKDFSSGAVRVLIATDVASRGLDVKDVGHVINMDLPRAFEDYVHRIGERREQPRMRRWQLEQASMCRRVCRAVLACCSLAPCLLLSRIPAPAAPAQHRTLCLAGRTGRAGTRGRATSFFTDRDAFLVTQIRTAMSELEKGNTAAFAMGKEARAAEKVLAQQFKANLKLSSEGLVASSSGAAPAVKVDGKYAHMATAAAAAATGSADAAWDD